MMRFHFSNWILGWVFLIGFFPCLASAQPSTDLRAFLFSTPNTYGWQPVKGEISYTFLKDGRLVVQGSDGEATLWEGKWTLAGDQVTLKIPALKTLKTVTVARVGDELILDGLRYRRYSP